MRAAASIPPYAVGPALLVVGSLMMMNVASIPWSRTGDAIPAFLTIVMMPLTYSIAYGEPAGLYQNSGCFTLFYAVHKPKELSIHTRESDCQ